MSYQGWSSHASWNCSLWINNDFGMYQFCKSLKHNNITSWDEVSRLLTIQFGSSVTPDNVAWELADPTEMERMLQELWLMPTSPPNQKGGIVLPRIQFGNLSNWRLIDFSCSIKVYGILCLNISSVVITQCPQGQKTKTFSSHSWKFIWEWLNYLPKDWCPMMLLIA